MKRALILSLLTFISAACFAAKPKPKAVDPEPIIAKAREAVKAYDFDEAESLMDDYFRAIKDSPKATDAEDLMKAARLGSQMLDRVESIVVIDSIIVDKNDFFKSYMLSPGAGSFSKASQGEAPIYMTENGLIEFLTITDNNDAHKSVGSSRILADGSVEAAKVFENAEGMKDCSYPFLMPDGLTLYFAGTGEQSLGGYDIFITRRGSADDDFLQPQNIGMPYNSPYDDYLLAIDEATGLGWWATDRNQIPGKVTIYVFIPSELRNNYSTDRDDIQSLAALKSIKSTQPADFKKPDIASLVKQNTPEPAVGDIEFALPGGRVIKDMSQLKSRRARDLMHDYINSSTQLEKKRETLAYLRNCYAKGEKSVASKILSLESEIEADAKALKSIANDIVRAEH